MKLILIMTEHSLYTTQPNGKQECIPVGCVPAARRPYAGVCFPGGGVWSRGEGLVPGGGYPSMHWGRPPPPLWTEWMTDRCKNITLATTSLRPVTRCEHDTKRYSVLCDVNKCSLACLFFAQVVFTVYYIHFRPYASDTMLSTFK